MTFSREKRWNYSHVLSSLTATGYRGGSLDAGLPDVRFYPEQCGFSSFYSADGASLVLYANCSVFKFQISAQDLRHICSVVGAAYSMYDSTRKISASYGLNWCRKTEKILGRLYCNKVLA